MNIQRNDASEAQVRAATPDSSTWLAANAGSGKTRVLTDRVARLLLREVDPQKILCLTYTKAAASEMQNRLFQRLGEWAMLDNAPLEEALRELGEDGPITPEDLSRARTLFALAIETPGGLKIQTIHSFCAGLLRRFPLEAGINPQFQEMEDRAGELLRAEIVDAMATGAQQEALRDLATEFTGVSFDKLTAEIVKNREGIPAKPDWPALAQRFNIALDFDASHIDAVLLDGSERDLLDRITPVFLSGSSTDQKTGTELARIQTVSGQCLPILEAAFLTKEKQPKKRLATNKTLETLGSAAEEIEALIERIMLARDLFARASAAKRSLRLHAFAAPFLTLYDAAKAQRGWLDFDDLILHTRALLTDPKVADWVLFRLDGGIAHLLVDEAQDTSPAQWDVIRKLTQEFTSGQGTEQKDGRTVFVVGDKKQSIYSFQGADPSAFDDMEGEFAQKLRTVAAPFQSRSLDFSFRSSDAILRLVDETFDGLAGAGFTNASKHRAFHTDMPGRVDIWPVIEPISTEEGRHWTDPIDRRSDTHHSVVLAHQVADQIEEMLARGHMPDRTKERPDWHLRPIQAGDIMILVQRRSPLFHEIIRACKQKGLPIAGADRLRVGAELAVRDLLALLSFLATPEDSLSLAAALRSPLFGWSEGDLFKLAHGRDETHLWQTLRNRREQHAETYAILSDLRNNIDFLRPFDLLERILTRHDGRKRLLARLGYEAQDGIDALLGQALGYERSAVPSLTGFLTWAQADELEIKRQVDSSGNLIRVMTVHGAKGLEAPIVFLPDCGNRRLDIKDEILSDDDTAIWKPKADASPDYVTGLLDAERLKQSEERLRLLYVAMTRAEKWLIVGAAGTLNSSGDDWYQRVQAAMGQVGALPHDFSNGPGLRFETGSWDLPKVSAPEVKSASLPALEPWMTQVVVEKPPRPDPLSPSDLEGPKALPSDKGLPDDIAMARGTYIHTLLEYMGGKPETQWPKIIDALTPPKLLSGDLCDAARNEAIAVLRAPRLKWLFEGPALAEVALQGEVKGHRMLGIVDRLLIEPEAVTVVDFKSNLAVPTAPEHCPEGLLRQMGAYAAMLAQIYPDRQINTGILWTRTAEYMSLPHSLVMDALDRAPRLDAALPGS